MRAKRIAPDEQFRLITECRQSGLSDYQWCQMHDINPGTFYNWISRLRKRGYSIPAAETEHNTPIENCQEVVKVALIPDHQVSTMIPARIDPAGNAHLELEPPTPTMEVSTGNATIRLFQNADRELVETVLRYMLGGAAYAG